jgi:hypothetical protein
MTRLKKGLLLALMHIAMVFTVAGKYYVDRTSLPRVWTQAVPFDRSLTIRGRYVRLQLAVEERGLTGGMAFLAAENGKLVAIPAGAPSSQYVTQHNGRWVLAEPVSFFIPGHAAVLSPNGQGEELWAEVSVPRTGAPRPIRLGVKRNGVLTPLDIR